MSNYARKLELTPTWAVAGVCASIIVISIGLEKVLHKAGTWLTTRHKRALFEALEKVKEELMILGFISLTLVFTQDYISEICIPPSVANTMLPCGRNDKSEPSKYTDYCRNDDKIALISIDGLHDIHILIFFLAVFHVFYSAVTMALGRLKIRGWKKWEQETASNNYEFTNDTSRFRLTHETSFVRAHTRFWTKIPIFFYIGCFFRQFFRSVSRSDYLTLRNGFINVHLAPGSKFDFQKYIKRSLEDDYKTVVGVSPVLWASFVIFLLLNVNGWQALFWASLLPLIIILIVGTKLQIILTKMALEITERHAVVQGIPLVQASDKYFWFGRPQLVLSFIHFVLFQNAFQVTYVLWVWYRYGIKSCFHDTLLFALVKIGLGLFVLILCSYITLPLYALIAQMGSSMKRSIFDEQTSKALKNWHMAAKKPHVGKSSRTLGNTSPTSSSMGSPFHPSRFQTAGRSPQHDQYASDVEDPSVPPPVTASLIRRAEQNEVQHDVLLNISPEGREHRNEDDFSFAKEAPGK